MMIATMKLTPEVERELRSRVRSQALRSDDVRRARLILMLSEGQSYSAIRQTLQCNRSYISTWKNRFVTMGLSGLYSRHRGKKVEKRTPKMEARILACTRKQPPDGSTHWSCRKLAQHLGISHMMVARVWKRA